VKSARRALFVSVLLATAGLAVAQDRPSDASSPAPHSGPAVSAGTFPLRQFRKGTLVGFDVEKGTITFKDESGKTLTWPVEVRLAEHARAYAEMRLKTLKEGDRVRVTYVLNDAGEPRVYDVRPFLNRGAGRKPADGAARPAAPASPAAPAPASPAPPQ